MDVGNTPASSNDDVFAPFSNYGKKVDIAAPGYRIYTTDKNSTWTTMSGTSASAPLVSGAIAIYKNYHPQASPQQVRNVLMNLASTPKTICDGNGHGYFTGYINNAPLPLLYAKGIENTSMVQSNSFKR
jgi:subtilisin family serine protease